MGLGRKWKEKVNQEKCIFIQYKKAVIDSSKAMVNSALAFKIFKRKCHLFEGSHLTCQFAACWTHTILRPDGCEPQVSLPKVLNIGPCREYAMYTKPLAGPTLEWWLGRGAPLNPGLILFTSYVKKCVQRSSGWYLMTSYRESPYGLFLNSRSDWEFRPWEIHSFFLMQCPRFSCFQNEKLTPGKFFLKRTRWKAIGQRGISHREGFATQVKVPSSNVAVGRISSAIYEAVIGLTFLGSAGLTGTQGWRKTGYYRLEGRRSHTQFSDLGVGLPRERAPIWLILGRKLELWVKKEGKRIALLPLLVSC